MEEEEEGKSIFLEELRICLSHLYLSAGKYFILSKRQARLSSQGSQIRQNF